MPATFTVELKSPARQDGTRAVRIRITKLRKHAYYNLGKYVLPSQWNKAPSPKLHNYVLKKEHPFADQINNAIKNALIGLDEVAGKKPAATAGEIKKAYEKALSPEPEEVQTQYRNFFEFASELVARRREVSYRAGESPKYMLEIFKAVAGENTPIEDLVSPRTLHKYVQHLKSRGNTATTINTRLKALKIIFNAGVKEKAFPDIEAFFNAARLKEPKKKLERPTADQVRQFIKYQPKNKLQEVAKNVTLLQYLLQGARISEALTLKWENIKENYVEYLPQKDARKPKFVPRSGMLNKLLESLPRTGPFVLPCLKEDYLTLTPRNQYNRKKRQIEFVNLGLKEISEELKIPKLKSHMFRHAFADAIIASGSNVHVAAALLGHANPRTTEGYIKDLQLQDVSGLALSIFDNLEGEHSGEQ